MCGPFTWRPEGPPWALSDFDPEFGSMQTGSLVETGGTQLGGDEISSPPSGVKCWPARCADHQVFVRSAEL
jgi:hypothetical protein